MITQDLLKYIEGELAKGTPKEVIQSNLLSNGWDAKDVAEGFSVIVPKNVTPPSTINPIPAINSTININPTPIINPTISNINPNINPQNIVRPISSPLIKLNFSNTSEPVVSKPTISNPAILPPVISQQDFQRMSASQAQPKQFHWVSIFITIFVILLILSGGAFAYYKYLNPNISPTDILKNSLKVSLNVKSFSFMATSSGHIESQLDIVDIGTTSSSSSLAHITQEAIKSYGYTIPPSVNFNEVSNMSGSFDFNSTDNLMYEHNLKINIMADMATSSNLSGSISSEEDMIYINKNIYAKLKDFSTSYTLPSTKNAAQIEMFIGMLNGFISSLENKWILLANINDIATSTINRANFTTEDIAMFKDYVVSMSYITALNNVGIENLNGIQTHHLKITIQHGQKLIDLMKKIVLEKQTLPVDELSEYSKKIDEMAKVITQKIDLDIWIEQKNYLVYKILSSPTTFTDEQTKTKITASGEITFSSYNQPVSISAPQDATPIEQVIQNIFGGIMGGISTTTSNETATSSVN